MGFRDFVLDLQDDEGNEINPDQYLEYVLEETEADNDYAEEHNEVRATLKRFFPERYCATLIRPSDDERDLQNLKSDPDLLKPEFVNQINDLRNFILNQIQIKTVGDIGLTGSDYISVISKYIDAINEGAIPRIEDSWVAVVENQLSNGYSKGLKSYEEGIEQFKGEYIPCNDEELTQAHKSLMQAAIEIFLEVTKEFDNQEKQDAYEQLQENIEQIYEAYRKANDEENETKLMDMANHLYRDQLLSKDFSSVDEYMRSWSELQDLFISQSESHKKYEVWCNFSQEKIREGCSKLERKVDMKKGLKEKQLEVEIDKYKTMLELKNNDNGDEKEKLEGEIGKLRDENQRMYTENKGLKDEVIAIREHLDSKDRDLDNLNEKFHDLRRQKDEYMVKSSENKRQNIRKDHIIMEETGKSATCSSNDCVIF